MAVITHDLAIVLNTFALTRAHAKTTPHGWCRVGACGEVEHYLASCGLASLYLDYNVRTGEIVGYMWD
jgi:hypothetical protein